VFQVEIDDGVHSDSASLGSNPSPPASLSLSYCNFLILGEIGANSLEQAIAARESAAYQAAFAKLGNVVRDVRVIEAA
jgi:hypothetical protein